MSLIAKYRPHVPVLAVSNSERCLRQCTLQYGVYPYPVTNMPKDM